MSELAPAIFLDKDGTVVENVPYNADPERIRLRPGAGEGLRALQERGYRLVMVSNQSGVARGLFPEAALQGVETALSDRLRPYGVRLDGFYYCPHHPEGRVAEFARDCECRKPRPGLILRAARVHGLNLSRSWLVGDILDDVEAAHRAGCRAVLVADGGETEWHFTPERTPDRIAHNLEDAARIILSENGSVVSKTERFSLR